MDCERRGALGKMKEWQEGRGTIQGKPLTREKERNQAGCRERNSGRKAEDKEIVIDGLRRMDQKANKRGEHSMQEVASESARERKWWKGGQRERLE